MPCENTTSGTGLPASAPSGRYRRTGTERPRDSSRQSKSMVLNGAPVSSAGAEAAGAGIGLSARAAGAASAAVRHKAVKVRIGGMSVPCAAAQ